MQWLDFMVESELVVFPRGTRPPGAKGGPWLVGFSDASLTAYCAVVYIRWATEKGFVSSLLIGKCLLSPMAGTMIPRAELQGLMVLLRLVRRVVEAMADKIERVVLAVDSECVIAALKKSGNTMGPFFANRVAEAAVIMGEVREQVDVLEEVMHVSGLQNPTDLGT